MSNWFESVKKYNPFSSVRSDGAAGPILGSMLLNTFTTLSQIKAEGLNTKIARNIEAFNYDLEKRNAAQAIKSSQLAAEDIRTDTTSKISEGVAAFGASNLVTTSGSPLLAQLEQRRLGETAVQDVLQQGLDAANAADMRAAMAGYRSEVMQKKAKNDKRQAIAGGIAKLGTSLYGMGA